MTIPCFEEAGISTLSTPTPARTTAVIFLAFSKKASSTSVEERVIATSAKGIILETSVSFGSSAALISSISGSFARISNPSWCIWSQTTMVFLDIVVPFL